MVSISIDVPVELRNAIESIKSEDSWKVLVFLSDGDKTKREIDLLGVDEGVVDALVKGGLVKRYVESLADLCEDDKNFYGLTALGRLFMNWVDEILSFGFDDKRGVSKEIQRRTVEAVYCDMYKEFIPVSYCMKHCGKFGGFVGFGVIRCKYEA